MRKIKVVEIDPTKFQAIGQSGINEEFKKIVYENKVVYEQKTFHLYGKQTVQTFIAAMNLLLDELAKTFVDEVSVAEQSADRTLLHDLSQQICKL